MHLSCLNIIVSNLDTQRMRGVCGCMCFSITLAGTQYAQNTSACLVHFTPVLICSQQRSTVCAVTTVLLLDLFLSTFFAFWRIIGGPVAALRVSLMHWVSAMLTLSVGSDRPDAGATHSVHTCNEIKPQMILCNNEKRRREKVLNMRRKGGAKSHHTVSNLSGITKQSSKLASAGSVPTGGLWRRCH